MRRRRTTTDTSSLELLLDTITNAFGGIVFLAILIVVLLQTTSPPTENEPLIENRNQTSLEIELQEIESALEPLEMEAASADQLSERLNSPELKSTLDQLQTQRRIRNQLTSTQLNTEERVEALRARIVELEQKQKSLDEDLERESESLETLESELAAERSSKRINSPFPEERRVSGSSFDVTIKYGRLYRNLKPDRTPNLDDFAVLDNSGVYLEVTPKPYKGIPVSSPNGLNNELRNLINKESRSNNYITIVIWDDSFACFQHLRDYLVEQGIQYRLIVLTEGGEAVYGGSTDARAQ